MKMIADLHCHTSASVHAYSTLHDNIEAALAKKLEVLAITDHGIGCPDSPPVSYFDNLTSLPEYVKGIRLLRGVEANIMDYDGGLDMPEWVMEKLDIVVASFHTSCTKPGTVEEHTNAYIQVAKNPLVRIIGHSGSAEFEYDYEKVIPIFGQYKKLVEINAHTFICRQKLISNCRRIAQLCMEHRVPVVVDSDAHSEFEVGECDRAFDMLREIGFPEELIINTDRERLNRYLESTGVKM